jgi:hypothetical protein
MLVGALERAPVQRFGSASLSNGRIRARAATVSHGSPTGRAVGSGTGRHATRNE